MRDVVEAARPHGGITRRDALKRTGLGLSAMALPGLVAACGSSGSDGGGGSGSTLRWGISSAPRSVDHLHNSPTGTLSNSLEGLLVYDDAGKLQPRLARSWRQPDSTTYVYELREGVRFWDGRPLTVDDVVFSMNQHLDPATKSQDAGLYANVGSIAAQGNAVVVKLKQPDPSFQYIPASNAGAIVQKAFLQEHGSNLGTAGVLTMGTGPYVIERFNPEQGITLRRNEDYWGEQPSIARVEISFLVDPATRLLALRSGEIDGTFEVPLSQVGQYGRVGGVQIESAPALSVFFFGLDTSKAPFDDLHVRRAIAHAVDRDGIVKALFAGEAEPAQALVPPSQWGNLLDASEVERLYAGLPAYPFDLAAARRELAASAHPDGFSASVQFPDSDAELGKVALSLAANLKQIGISLKVRQVPRDQWISDLFAHTQPITAVDFKPDYPDPSNEIGLLLPSAGAKPGAFNVAQFKNARVDALLAQQADTSNPAQRARAIGELLQITGEELPYVPVVFPKTAMAVHDGFTYTGFNGLYQHQPWIASVRAAS